MIPTHLGVLLGLQGHDLLLFDDVQLGAEGSNLIGPLLRDSYGWRNTFLFVGFLAILVVLVGGHFLGPLFSGLAATGVSLYAAYALHRHWKLEEAFDRELYTRAAYVVNTPNWAR